MKFSLCVFFNDFHTLLSDFNSNFTTVLANATLMAII